MSDVENDGNSCESGNEVLSLAEESAIEECLKDSEGSLSTVYLELFNDFPDKAPKRNTRHKKSLAKRLTERYNFKYLTDIETNSDDDDSDFCPAKRKLNCLTILRGKISDIRRTIGKGAADVTKSEEAKANSVVDVNLAKVMDEVEEMERVFRKDLPVSSKDDYVDGELANDAIPVSLTTNEKNNENRANDVTSVNEKRVNDVSISNTASNNKKANINTNDDIKNQSFCNIVEDSKCKWMEPSTSSSHVPRLKMKLLRRKAKRKAKKQLDNTHIYSFFSSMADQVSTLPYDSTLTAKSKITSLLEDMVIELKEWNQDTSPQKMMQGHELSEKDLKLIEIKLSMLPFVY